MAKKFDRRFGLRPTLGNAPFFRTLAEVDAWMDQCRKREAPSAARARRRGIVTPELYEPDAFSGTWVNVRGVRRPAS